MTGLTLYAGDPVQVHITGHDGATDDVADVTDVLIADGALVITFTPPDARPSATVVLAPNAWAGITWPPEEADHAQHR